MLIGSSHEHKSLTILLVQLMEKIQELSLDTSTSVYLVERTLETGAYMGEVVGKQGMSNGEKSGNN